MIPLLTEVLELVGAGLLLAGVSPLFKKAEGFESPKPHRFRIINQELACGVRKESAINYTRNGGLS
ncbi:hypothetical protein ACOTTU_02265 [Roseobacter sp. EG26]|uniref:hypothetical protein n=1 Tax=Roseobacter sp. EG26 TaxID=3412477 RepID=UPI003CE46E10